MEAFAVIFLLSSALFPAATAAAKHGAVPALYLFGDSLVDVGNNNFLCGSKAVANFRPYGVDYPGGRPTGRFSNGYIFVDFLAKKLGFKGSPPPALSLSTASQELLGVNYASGGSGVLDSTGAEAVSIPMNSQLQLFAKTASRLAAAKGTAAAEGMLERSLFIFNVGGNDVFEYFLAAAVAAAAATNRSSVSPVEFVSTVVVSFQNQLKSLYELGARKYVVFGVPPGGCAPAMRAMAGGACSDDLNGLIQMYNGAVQGMLRNLTDMPGFEYSFINTYDLAVMVIANPKPYGFSDVINACCRTDAAGFCLPNTTNFCPDRRRFVFWDASHPTQSTNKLIADYSFLGSAKFASPVNIAQLSQ